MQRAYRKFLSGRPPAAPKTTPLGAVTLVAEQRARLTKILTEFKVKGARVTSAAVVVRFVPPVPAAPADTILVQEGAEGQAAAHLEKYWRLSKQFVICGLLFAVQAEGEKRPFAFPIERTEEGEGALMWAYERQMQRKPHKAIN